MHVVEARTLEGGQAAASASRPTIRDVAQLAGVDVSTVSRAIHGNPRISSATRARVARAIADLDYRPNAAARAMVTRRTRTFAFLVPRLADPNIADLAAGAESRARAVGYSMVVAGYRPSDDPTGERHGVFGEHRVDGILLMSPRHYPTARLELPVATLEEARVDNHAGGRLVGMHLRTLGHRRAVFVGGPHDSPHARERVRGFLSGFGDEVTVRYGDWTSECGAAVAGLLLDELRDVTAVFAASDSVALGVLHALHERGLDVPRDVSVVGFDDQAVYRYAWPRLTTVAQPLSAVGATAFDLLHARMAGAEPDPPEPLPVRLVERESSGPAPTR